MTMRMATAGRYRLSAVEDVILAAADKQDIRSEVQMDLTLLDLEAVLTLLPVKKQGGFMQNRKIILKKYVMTAYDPGYHDSKLRCTCLRLVPIDEWNAIISLDDVTIETDSLIVADYLGP